MLPTFTQLSQHLMLPQLLQSAVENLLNYLLKHTAHCDPYLRKLANKTLAIHLQGIQMPMYLLFSAKGVDVLSHYDGETDCSITIAPRLLLQMPQKAQISQYLNDKSITLQGNLQVLQDVVALIEFLEKDPAELLSRYIGDVPAQLAVNFIRQLKTHCEHHFQQSQQFWGERLTEEWQLLSPSLAVADFCQEVNLLEKNTALLEQKIAKLQQIYQSSSWSA